MVRIAVSRSKTERHQTALRGQALTCSHVRTASPAISLSREMLDVAPQKPLRADEPVTQNDELGLRRVTAATTPTPRESRPAYAFGMAWLLAAPASVSLHSVVGPQQSFRRCPINVEAIEDGFLRVRCCNLRSPTWGPIQPSGVRQVPQRDGEVKPQKMVSKVAVVVSAPVRRAAPQAGPKVRHGRSCR